MPALLSLALLFTVGGDPGDARPTAALVPLTFDSVSGIGDQVTNNWVPHVSQSSEQQQKWVEQIRRQWENITKPYKPGQTLPSSYYVEDGVQYQAAKPPQPASQTLPAPMSQPTRATAPRDIQHCGVPSPLSLPDTGPKTWEELCSRRAPKTISKEQHLRSAADHLQAAGLQEESDMLRKRADAESVARKQRELAAKLHQLEKLKREIEVLSRDIAPQDDRNLVMHISLVEVAEEAWQETLEPALAENISKQLDDQSDVGGIVFENAEVWNKAVNQLREAKQAKILAAPTIATIAGRPCKFHSGGQAPTVVEVDGQQCLKMTPFGTMIGLCPKMGTGDNLTLEIDAEIATVSLDSTEKFGGVNAGVVRSDFRTNINAGMKLGQSIAVVSPVSKDGEDEKPVRTILVIHAEGIHQ